MITFFETGEIQRPLVDQQKLARVSLGPYQLKEQALKFFDGIDFAKPMLRSFREQQGEGLDIRFLRIRERAGQRTALFRLTNPEGLIYFEWYLEKNGDGEVAAWDADNYVTGERISETLCRVWIKAVIEIDPSYAKHMGKRNKLLVDHFGAIGELRNAKVRGQYEQAIQVYEAMPGLLRDELVCMVQALPCYVMVEDFEKYESTLKRFMRLHAGASNQELIGIDLYFMNAAYDRVLEAVDALDKRVGGDPYLNLYRANAQHMKDAYANAVWLIDRGLQADPAMIDFYWAGIEMALYEEDWGRVGKLLDAVQAQGIELYPLTEVEGYEAYIETQAYEAWVGRQTKAVQDEQRGVDAEPEADTEQ